MKEGEEFKPFADLLSADPSNDLFWVTDGSPPEGMRPSTLLDRYNTVAELGLPNSVPQEASGYFDAARMLWTFGWFYYPFYTWTSLHAGLCAEIGLRRRFEQEAVRLSRHQARFAGMLDEAAARGWLKREGFSRWRNHAEERAELLATLRSLGEAVPEPNELLEDDARALKSYLRALRQMRNGYAHPNEFFYTTPDSGLNALEAARDLLVQLFPPTAVAPVI